MKNQWTAYVAGAVLLFGAAFWASILPLDYKGVVLLMGVPSLFAGYYFARFPMPYIWGALLGIALYMGLEYMVYGPIYKVSGPVYGAAYILAIACCLTGVWISNWRLSRSNQGLV